MRPDSHQQSEASRQARDASQGHSRPTWERIALHQIEDLSDAVLGAGLEATQVSRGKLGGSLAFAEIDKVVFSSGHIGGRVELKGPLSLDCVTLGVGLQLPPGAMHWMSDVTKGNVGVFLPGDEHDSLYTPGSLYTTATLDMDTLEELAAARGLVLDRKTLGTSGMHDRIVPPDALEWIEKTLIRVHAGNELTSTEGARLATAILDVMINHCARAPRRTGPRPNPQGYFRTVARAREYIEHALHENISVDDIARAACTSRRSLYRAFGSVLDMSPDLYVRQLRLHRIRRDLSMAGNEPLTVAEVSSRWNMNELGRMAGYYRDLFGELPSETARRHLLAPRVPGKSARFA